jgi:predicted nuclease of predicted toxin-antitoxin system
MKVLLNENIPPSLAIHLREFGWQAVHVRDVDLIGASDHSIIDYALANGFVILTHDLDYGQIVAVSGKAGPSVITFHLEKISAQILFRVLNDNLTKLNEYLSYGVLISVDDEKIRVRQLTIARS